MIDYILIKNYEWSNRDKNLEYMSGNLVGMSDSLHSLESGCKESRVASLSLMKNLRTTEALRKYPDWQSVQMGPSMHDKHWGVVSHSTHY